MPAHSAIPVHTKIKDLILLMNWIRVYAEHLKVHSIDRITPNPRRKIPCLVLWRIKLILYLRQWVTINLFSFRYNNLCGKNSILYNSNTSGNVTFLRTLQEEMNVRWQLGIRSNKYKYHQSSTRSTIICPLLCLTYWNHYLFAISWKIQI